MTHVLGTYLYSVGTHHGSACLCLWEARLFLSSLFLGPTRQGEDLEKTKVNEPWRSKLEQRRNSWQQYSWTKRRNTNTHTDVFPSVVWGKGPKLQPVCVCVSIPCQDSGTALLALSREVAKRYTESITPCLLCTVKPDVKADTEWRRNNNTVLFYVLVHTHTHSHTHTHAHAHAHTHTRARTYAHTHTHTHTHTHAHTHARTPRIHAHTHSH